MDKRLTGKWYKSEMGETLNIFDETPLRMKMSFSSSGHYNFEPNCVYEKDEFLCFEINDEKYRMVYHIKFIDDHLEGYYTQFGKKTPVKYSLVSKLPEDEEYRFVPVEVYVPETEEKRIDLLKKYAFYDRKESEKSYATEYKLCGKTPAILEKYHYSQYIKDVDASDDAIVFRVLDFVCDHFQHNGSGGMSRGKKINDIIAFCENHEGKTNCRGLAILLASLLRLSGIKARHITCMPYEDPFCDCHVVVDCLLPSGKRIMLDPTWRLYLKDSNDTYISLERLRKMLIEEEPVFANQDASYNGTGFDKEYYRNYMIKNAFRFSRGTLCADGFDERGSRRIELIPANYPVENFKASAREEFVYNDIAFWKM